MKSKIIVFVLFTLVFSQAVMAQENDKTTVSTSIGFPIVHLDVPIGRDYTYSSGEIGLNVNLMFFKNSNFGYFFNIYGLFNMISTPNPSIVVGDPVDQCNSLFFGIIPGIGYKKSINDDLSFFAGIGPEIRLDIVNLDDSSIQFGFGIGGILEIRLKLFSNFSFAGGALISSNFFSEIYRDFGVHPYIGFAWN
jgi:hypothetical protein